MNFYNGTGYNLSLQVVMLLAGLSLFGCKVSEGQQGLLAYDNLPGRLYVSLTHPYELDNDDYEMVVSTPREAKSLTVCEVEEATGECGVEESARLIFASEERNFYVADKSVLLEHGLILALIAKNESKDIIDMRTFSFYNNEDPSPGAGGRGRQGGSGSPFSQNQSAAGSGSDLGLLERSNCSVAGCHSNFNSYSTAEKFDALNSGRMPRGRPISPEDKDALLRYFNGG